MFQRKIWYAFTLLLFISTQVWSQFDVSDYANFLETSKNLSANELLSQYPADTFLESAEANFADALYSELVDENYKLTLAEKELLQRQGFIVTERLSYPSFGDAYGDIYHKDLPVFITTDSILHALHMSYDLILTDVEVSRLIPNLDNLLKILYSQIPILAQKYAQKPELLTMLKDVDVYVTVTRKLLGVNISPVYPDNVQFINQIMNAINGYQPVRIKLFSNKEREIDFSQFRPRGHYADPAIYGDELASYFKAMIWLGRTEMYLTKPKSHDPIQQEDEDIQRQTIDAVLIAEAAKNGSALSLIEDIDEVLSFLIGNSDNVTIDNILSLMDETGINSADELLEKEVWETFQNNLLEKEYASQRILSQILFSNPMNPEQVEPACSFMLLGQRFAIDSFITGNVVYDKIIHNGLKVGRMLPSSLDVLFALGNNAPIQLLEPGLDEYHYAPNLAALRYLIDSYDPEVWDSTLYNCWLNAIRTLNPPEDRDFLPKFMQTASWWQEKMNTQLAAWAQLRHDNLLYVKQSYSAGGIICSYPESFVEPYPEFYRILGGLADRAVQKFGRLNVDARIVRYFRDFSVTMNSLGEIAQRELDRVPLTQEERDFLQRMWSETLVWDYTGSFTVYDGWYVDLFYDNGLEPENGLWKQDLVVADIHTVPTDEFGNPLGYVMHVGTGPINMAFFVCDIGLERPVAFVGPVLSYYERITTGFKRLTDQEWEILYKSPPSYRPSFVNLYMTDEIGMPKGDIVSLYTYEEQFSIMGEDSSAVEPDGKKIVTLGYIKANTLLQNYPNPFNPETWIPFSLQKNMDVLIEIRNVQGQIIRTLSLGYKPEGLYLDKEKAAYWDGKNEAGEFASSGVYFYTIHTGDFTSTRKMVVSR